MDAVEYIKNLDKMCAAHVGCTGCPIRDVCGPEECQHWSAQNAETAVRIVEAWAETRKMTNARKFHEVFGFYPALLVDDLDWRGQFHPLLTSPAFWREMYHESAD